MGAYFISPESGTFIRVQNGSQDLLDKAFSLLRKRGFAIQTDRDVLENYPSIADSYWEGSKGDLLFKSEIHPAGFKLEFYQEANTESPGRGQYEFDKLGAMPYLIKCEFLIIRKCIQELLKNEGVENNSEPVFKYALDDVMYRIKSSCHYEEGKELPEYEIEDYNSKDRDGKQLYNGQIKYYRDRKGRLMRGTIYHNINNMWWVILNKYDFTNQASFHLFDITTEEDLSPKVYSRKIPYRIRAEKARERFNRSFDYAMVRETHIDHLRVLLSNELALHSKDMDMSIKTPLKKDMKVLKTRGLIHAKIEVNGSYFSGREAITFSQSGFIGFAGWADSYNVKPFVIAFEKWLDWLDEILS